MEKFVELLPYLLPVLTLVAGAVSGIVAWLKGKSSKSATEQLTENEQRQDLNNFMVAECCRVETFSSFLKPSMTKEELSKWKSNEVVKNLMLYAKANDYSWCTNDECVSMVTTYIANANVASGKKKA